MKGITRITKEDVEKLLSCDIDPYFFLKCNSWDLWEEVKTSIWEWQDKREEKEISFAINHLSSLVVKGNTYAIKDFLKSLGFRWDSFEKHWYKRVASVEEAIELVEKIKKEVSK